MNIIFYTILFIIGVVVGSYCKVEVCEIPKIFDWRRKHYSKHKNENLRLKLTYSLIGGILSVITAITLKMNISNIDLPSIIIYFFSMIYISTLIVIAGVDKNYSKIDKKTLAFGIVSSIVYMIYVFTIDASSVYLNIRYLLIYMALLLLDAFLLRKFAKDSYIVNVLILLVIMLVYSSFRILLYTVIMSLVAILLYTLIVKSLQRGKKELKIDEIPIAFFITSSHIIILFVVRIIECYFA